MRRLGVWRNTPLPFEAYMFKKAFAVDTMTFLEWLQFVFLARARELVMAGRPLPKGGGVGTLAVREFDGLAEFDQLTRLLNSFESWIEASWGPPLGAAPEGGLR